jgi:membrane protease YdiL (CAAX protease family)
LLLAWALSRWLGISPTEHLRLSLETVVWGVAATGPLLAGLAWMLTTRYGPVHRLVTLVVEQLGPLLVGRSVVELALLAAIAGISEEVLFRGVVQVALARVLPGGWALVAASAAFGLAHFASRTYALMAGVMGLYLGGLFLLQGSLLTPIITHALYDLVALVLVARRYGAALRPPVPQG